MSTEGRKTSEERKELLARHLASLLTQGRRIESQSDFQAVLVIGRPVNHVFHIIATLVTIGLWGIVWLSMVGFGGERRELMRVDEWGNTSISKL